MYVVIYVVSRYGYNGNTLSLSVATGQYLTLSIHELYIVTRGAPIPDFTDTSSTKYCRLNVFTSTSTDTDTWRHYRMCVVKIKFVFVILLDNFGKNYFMIIMLAT